MKQNRTYRLAFTLLEMMVASSLGAFIAIVALSGLRSVTAARGAIDKHSEAVDELRIAAEQIRADLVNVQPFGRTMRFEGLIEQDAAEPTPRLIFRTFSRKKVRPDQPESELYEVEYFVSKTENGKALMRRACPMLGVNSQVSEEKTDGGVIEIIAEPILGVDISYFDGGNWSNQWSAENMRPPQLVLVNLAVGQTLATGAKKLYTRQVAAGFNQGQFTEETSAADFNWQQVEGQWQQTETEQ
jgi:type II secretory pathway component PulJ